jgi:hypothetical protein
MGIVRTEAFKAGHGSGGFAACRLNSIIGAIPHLRSSCVVQVITSRDMADPIAFTLTDTSLSR